MVILWESIILLLLNQTGGYDLTLKLVTDNIVLLTPLDQLAPTESLYAEVFVQTESTNEVLSSQNVEDQGSKKV